MRKLIKEAPPANKHEARTAATRARILDAAEDVFVKEGFERAQLEQIAAKAGNTRGAVYAHFSSKEDLFLALLEQRMQSRVQEYEATLHRLPTRSLRKAAIREFYTSSAADKGWAILTLEFKLFALRHPEARSRLRNVYSMIHPANVSQTLLFGAMKPEDKRLADVGGAALSALRGGLVLESYFKPKLLTQKEVRLVLGRAFDALFGL